MNIFLRFDNKKITFSFKRALQCLRPGNKSFRNNADVATWLYRNPPATTLPQKYSRRRLIVYPSIIPMKDSNHFVRELSLWPLLDTECPFCAHRKCGGCREVSFSVAACCHCRTRAIERLKVLQEQLKKKSDKMDDCRGV
jgi:hypothetical protein